MKSTFGKKLFRFFLLFAFIPSIVIAITTFWLSVGVVDLFDQPNQNVTNQISAYYTDFINNQMLNAIEQNDSSAVDFIAIKCDQKLKTLFVNSNIDSTIVKKSIALFGDKTEGFIEIEKQLIQLVAVPTNENCQTIAGIIHDKKLSELLAIIEPEQAQNLRIKDFRIQIGSFLLVALVIVSLITLMVAYFFSARYAKNLSKPISLLSAASKDVAAGNFERQIDYTSSGELQVLIDSFNEMTSKLRSTTERLTQAQRVAAWRSIARRFAHDLKNPLQPISISLYRIRQLAEKAELIEALDEPLNAAEEELKQLTQLANRFSDLSQVPPPVFDLVNINDLLSSIVELYSDEQNSRQIIFNANDNEIITRTDQTYLREVLHNLIKNATEATSSDSKIELILSTTVDTIKIAVKDNGLGMDADTVKNATQPYYTTKKSGSGLGLAVAEKTIVELGGQMKVESELGVGTSITIYLPHKDSNV